MSTNLAGFTLRADVQDTDYVVGYRSAISGGESRTLVSVLKTAFWASPVLVAPTLGTPASGTLTNTTGFPAANLAGTALPAAIVSSSLTSVGTIATGVWNATVIADGKIASALTGKTYNGLTLTSTTGTLTIAALKTLTVNDTVTLGTAGIVLGNSGGLTVATSKVLTVNASLTLAGTDATTLTFPTTSATIARTDAAQTFTGTQTFSGSVTLSTGNTRYNLTRSGTGEYSGLSWFTGAAEQWFMGLRETGTANFFLYNPGTASNGVTIARADNAVTLAGTLTFSGTSSITAAASTNLVLNGGSSGDILTLGQGAATTSTFNLTGYLTVAGGNTGQIRLSHAGNLGIQFFDTAGTHYNWLVASQFNTSNAFEITPSTATGGTTFTTPALSIAGATNHATFSGSQINNSNANPYLVFTAPGWSGTAQAYIGANLNNAGSSAGDNMTFFVPTGKGFSWSVNATSALTLSASAFILSSGATATFNSTTDASALGTASVVLSGGLSVAKAARHGGPVVFMNYTVATLPTASSWTYGVVFVSDSNQAAGTSIGSAVTAGGAVKRAVYSDGINWLLL